MISPRDGVPLQTKQEETHVNGLHPGRELPVIWVNNRQLRDVSADALDALYKANDPPAIFTQGGSLARVRQDDEGQPIIDFLSEAMLARRLTRVANFLKTLKNTVIQVNPPPASVRDILPLGQWQFPSLRGVVEIPILRSNGTILSTTGYDRSTGLLYQPAPSLLLPTIPERPTGAQISHAVSVIDDILFDFPFVDQASRAKGWAAVLTPTVRAMIGGCTPMGLLDAPEAGTGKGLSAEVISMVATGRNAAMFSAPREDEEWRKQITTALKGGTTIIVIVNLEGRLDAPGLSRALTSKIWADRPLRTNEDVFLPNRATCSLLETMLPWAAICRGVAISCGWTLGCPAHGFGPAQSFGSPSSLNSCKNTVAN